MSDELYTFSHTLSPEALHIDYLRLRCGREKEFERLITGDAFKPHVRAQIAFSEWDVVMFVPSTELYPPKLIEVYSNCDITNTLAGSTGFLNYLWSHPINNNWRDRLDDPDKTFSMLISVRFTDHFRRRYGIGAELLFCSFLAQKFPEGNGISATVAHSIGWNDATVLLDAKSGSEPQLIDALTSIRFCTEANCVSGRPPTGVIAATYSHLLGNLRSYSSEHTLPFHAFGEKLKTARFLMRVSPAGEKALRKDLKDLLHEHAPPEPKPEDRLGSELGHYNFSASIGDTLRRPDSTVSVVQGFRELIGRSLLKRPHESSFPETTTEITFKEDGLDDVATVDPAIASAATLSSVYKGKIEELLSKPFTADNPDSSPLPAVQTRASVASGMTRHRLAILLGTIITYLDDPVRGSVVGHLCRFLTTMFQQRLTASDRAGQEDLCHILEYALQQATEGLTQFQHDANALDLSGRGGYSRLIHAVEEFIDQILKPFKLQLFPLLTFGLRPSSEGTALQYWIDLPFSVAFVPQRWYIAYHDLAQMCWRHTFEWRLDSYRVWQEFSRDVTDIQSHTDEEHRMQFVLGRDVVEELFPNYVILNIVAAGKADVLDRLMLVKEFLTRPRPALIHGLTVQLALHALLSLHQDQWQPDKPAVDKIGSSPNVEECRKECVGIAFGWWDTWWTISEALREKDPQMTSKVGMAVEAGAKSLRKIIDGLKGREQYMAREAAQAFESTDMLVSTPTFKADALRVVERVIRLLALRGRDYKSRSRLSFDLFDPSAVRFGSMIAEICRMREVVGDVTAEQISTFQDAIHGGSVFAAGIRPSTFARMVTYDVAAGRQRSPSMISSLSSVLTLWHAAVTRDLTSREQPNDLLGTLQELRVVRKFR